MASIALHMLGIAACYLFAAPRVSPPDFVVTVRLIASPLSVASRAAASDPPAHVKNEDPATSPLDGVAITKTPSRLAQPEIDQAKSPESSSARRAASRTKQRLPLPRPDMPAIPSQPLDQNENLARHSETQYSEFLAKRLSAVTKYPELAVARHDEGKVILLLRLDRDGHVLQCEIVGSSGRDILDEEVLLMVKAAEPFPPFPASLDRAAADFTIPITFALN